MQEELGQRLSGVLHEEERSGAEIAPVGAESQHVDMAFRGPNEHDRRNGRVLFCQGVAFADHRSTARVARADCLPPQAP